jgi:hypothetical protein
MDSKMRPLWLVFQNQDGLGDDILQIFKNGDGRIEHMLHIHDMYVHICACTDKKSFVHECVALACTKCEGLLHL